MHQIMLISLFSTSFDHFHFRGFTGLICKLILTLCHTTIHKMFGSNQIRTNRRMQSRFRRNFPRPVPCRWQRPGWCRHPGTPCCPCIQFGLNISLRQADKAENIFKTGWQGWKYLQIRSELHSPSAVHSILASVITSFVLLFITVQLSTVLQSVQQRWKLMIFCFLLTQLNTFKLHGRTSIHHLTTDFNFWESIRNNSLNQREKHDKELMDSFTLSS